MKVTITIEDKGTNGLVIIAKPSFEQMMKMRKAGNEDPSIETAVYALMKILTALKDSKNKRTGLILPPSIGMN